MVLPKIRVFLMVLAFVALQAVPALANPIYTITDVAVDQTAETPALAKDQGVATAKQQAWQQLLERVVTDVVPAADREISDADLDSLISSLQFSEERHSDVRYLAVLTVAFNPDAVRTYFADKMWANVQLADQKRLVIPVLHIPPAIQLWEEESLWLQAWQGTQADAPLAPYRLPYYDLQDMQLLRQDQVLYAAGGTLDPLRQRYQVDTITFAQVQPGLDAEGRQILDITLRSSRLGEEYSARPLRARVMYQAQNQPAMFQEAVETSLRLLQQEWKRANLTDPQRPQRLNVTARLAQGLKSWTELRKKLNAVPVVKDISLTAIALNEVRFEMEYAGQLSALQHALRQGGLTIVNQGTHWFLQKQTSPIRQGTPSPIGGQGVEQPSPEAVFAPTPTQPVPDAAPDLAPSSPGLPLYETPSSRDAWDRTPVQRQPLETEPLQEEETPRDPPGSSRPYPPEIESIF